MVVGTTIGQLLTNPPPPIQWVIEELLSEGVTVFAGPPKLGKSLMALQLCSNVTLGHTTLGKFTTKPGRIHYFGLEDNLRRFYDRVKIQKLEIDPDKFHVYTETEPGQYTLNFIEGLVTAFPDTKIVVIDTMEKVRGESKARTQYSADYEFVGAFQQIALKYHIAIILVHHTREMENPDQEVLDAVSGTRGITAAAENIWVLQRAKNISYNADLRILGKGMDSADYVLDFDSDRLTWEISGEGHTYAVTERRQQILDLISKEGPLGLTEIHQKLVIAANGSGEEIKYNAVAQTLRRMAKVNQLIQPKTGIYAVRG